MTRVQVARSSATSQDAAVALRRDAKIELLKRAPLFSGCSKSELRALASSADELDLRQGTVITREGRPGREFFVLISGTASVTKNGEKVAEIGRASGRE